MAIRIAENLAFFSVFFSWLFQWAHRRVFFEAMHKTAARAHSSLTNFTVWHISSEKQSGNVNHFFSMLWGLPDETERGKLQKTGSLTVIGDLTEATNSWPNLLFCDAGVPEREDERALRGGGVRDQQQPICDAVPNNDHFHLGDSVLLHGPASSGLHALPLLRALPLRERDCRREPDDGHRQRHPELPDGHHHRGWDSGFLYLLASHPYHVLTPCTFGLSASSDALLDLQMFRSQNLQGIFMLLSGYFRLRKDIPKPFWRYPMSYISFHFWALQVNLKTQCSLPGVHVFQHRRSGIPPARHRRFPSFYFPGTVPERSQGTGVQRADSRDEDPGRVHPRECVPDRRGEVQVDRPQRALLHDRDVPHHILLDDQDQRGRDPLGPGLHRAEEDAAEEWEP